MADSREQPYRVATQPQPQSQWVPRAPTHRIFRMDGEAGPHTEVAHLFANGAWRVLADDDNNDEAAVGSLLVSWIRKFYRGELDHNHPLVFRAGIGPFRLFDPTAPELAVDLMDGGRRGARLLLLLFSGITPTRDDVLTIVMWETTSAADGTGGALVEYECIAVGDDGGGNDRMPMAHAADGPGWLTVYVDRMREVKRPIPPSLLQVSQYGRRGTPFPRRPAARRFYEITGDNRYREVAHRLAETETDDSIKLVFFTEDEITKWVIRRMETATATGGGDHPTYGSGGEPLFYRGGDSVFTGADGAVIGYFLAETNGPVRRALVLRGSRRRLRFARNAKAWPQVVEYVRYDMTNAFLSASRPRAPRAMPALVQMQLAALAVVLVDTAAAHGEYGDNATQALQRAVRLAQSHIVHCSEITDTPLDCLICLEKPATIVYKPCCHRICCAECLPKLDDGVNQKKCAQRMIGRVPSCVCVCVCIYTGMYRHQSLEHQF